MGVVSLWFDQVIAVRAFYFGFDEFHKLFVISFEMIVHRPGLHLLCTNRACKLPIIVSNVVFRCKDVFYHQSDSFIIPQLLIIYNCFSKRHDS